MWIESLVPNCSPFEDSTVLRMQISYTLSVFCCCLFICLFFFPNISNLRFKKNGFINSQCIPHNYFRVINCCYHWHMLLSLPSPFFSLLLFTCCAVCPSVDWVTVGWFDHGLWTATYLSKIFGSDWEPSRCKLCLLLSQMQWVRSECLALTVKIAMKIFIKELWTESSNIIIIRCIIGMCHKITLQYVHALYFKGL